ncbi:MAG: hypothetical protein KAX49_20615, partial [Halanaerobiales bacterium]|nr:hypothetical protein [Halanaerobiales bacterium]
YDPEIGRFITEDTYQGEISNSQSQNIFIYVMNNPMRYVDPTGNNAITKSINSFKEIGIGFWNGFKYRSEHSFDSPYDFFNYCTIGILDATWSGAKERASKMTDSPYDFVNWLSFDTVGIFKGALFPEERFSAEHWMNSIGAAGMLISGMELLNRSAGSGLLDDLGDDFINKGIKEADEVAGELAEESKTEYARRRGKIGEEAAGITKNTKRIESITGKAKYRIPDGLDELSQVLTEVKNVKRQGYTSQIKDFYLWSKNNGYEFVLKTRPNTIISRPLQKLINAGKIIHEFIEQ